MFPNTRRFNAHGFTLIEIIITIVVLAIAATTLLSVFTSTARTSADPMIQQQAISIAEAYMEEIVLKNFSDPDPEVDEADGRENYDDVQDYHNLIDIGAKNQNNNAISQLSDYSVTVKVEGAELNGILDTDSMRIDITVNHPAISPITITGYRTKY
jgi:MSHA pilin protein MshD